MKKLANKLSLLFGLTLSLTCAYAQTAEATNYYVSKSGNNADGLSWQSGWNELDQINWARIQPNDQIFIDGGPVGGTMTYNTSLRIGKSGTPGHFIVVSSALDAGHVGNVLIEGNNRANFSGIVLNNKSYIVFRGNGSPRGWLQARRCRYGLYANGGSQNFFQGLELANNAVGAYLNGDGVAVVASDIHDNKNNATISRTGASAVDFNGLSACWVYNSDGQPVSNTDGVYVLPGTTAGGAGTQLANCVFGPNLTFGVDNSYKGLKLSGSLLLNASNANIVMRDDTSVTNCTLFLTRKNANNLPTKALSAVAGNNSVANTIVFRGRVEVPAGVAYGPKNTQIGTTGNTSALSSAMVNPMFVSPVGTYPDNVSFSVLRGANFALRPGSPATGTGAMVTSVDSVRALHQ